MHKAFNNYVYIYIYIEYIITMFFICVLSTVTDVSLIVFMIK